MANILIIDDDRAICKTLVTVMQRLGHHAVFRSTLREGLDEVSSATYDVIYLDVRLPDGSGLNGLSQIRRMPSSPEVIIITGKGDPDGAELAIRNDAWDYIEKPLSREAVILPLKRALQYRESKKISRPSKHFKREHIIGNCKPIRHCLDLVAQAAESDAGVLITGETGTGKELFAAAIHENSSRRENSFVVVDCASLPETLVESMLFGHQKGSFTGADKDHEGLIRQADKGTLFLDEIGELPRSMQKTFLRVLQEHRFRPVGAKTEIESDFRLVAATNRDLDQMVSEGKFRQDLLFRVRSIVIGLPPLKMRKGDIRELAMHFMNHLCSRKGIATKGFSPEFIESLGNYPWPGNVRELENCMKSTLAIAGEDPVLYPQHLPTYIRVEMARGSVGKKGADKKKPAPKRITTVLPGRFRDFREKALTEAEAQYLNDLMALSQWNIKEACRISGLSRPRLYALLKKYHITRNR